MENPDPSAHREFRPTQSREGSPASALKAKARFYNRAKTVTLASGAGLCLVSLAFPPLLIVGASVLLAGGAFALAEMIASRKAAQAMNVHRSAPLRYAVPGSPNAGNVQGRYPLGFDARRAAGPEVRTPSLTTPNFPIARSFRASTGSVPENPTATSHGGHRVPSVNGIHESSPSIADAARRAPVSEARLVRSEYKLRGPREIPSNIPSMRPPGARSR